MFTIFLRAVIIFVVLLVVIRLMGKRQLGEMEPFELVITLVIAEIACIPMGEPGLPLTYGIVSILTLFLMHQLISILGLKSLTARKIINGKPTILIDKNGINYAELGKLNMTISDLQQSVRTAGYFNFDEIMYAILEGNGKLSVLPYAPTTAPPEQVNLPLTLILEGKVMEKEVSQAGITKEILNEELNKSANLRSSDVLYLGMDGKGKMYIQPKKGKYIVHNLAGVNGDW
jgi:uncharacterized membrane protein YcaP (DUF421 family)